MTCVLIIVCGLLLAFRQGCLLNWTRTKLASPNRAAFFANQIITRPRRRWRNQIFVPRRLFSSHARISCEVFPHPSLTTFSLQFKMSCWVIYFSRSLLSVPIFLTTEAILVIARERKFKLCFKWSISCLLEIVTVRGWILKDISCTCFTVCGNNLSMMLISFTAVFFLNGSQEDKHENWQSCWNQSLLLNYFWLILQFSSRWLKIFELFLFNHFVLFYPALPVLNRKSLFQSHNWDLKD